MNSKLLPLFFLTVITFCLSTNITHATEKTLTADVNLSFDADGNEQSGQIVFSLANNSSNLIQVLKWHTPFLDNIGKNLFWVTLNGKEIPYTGRLVKYGKPNKESYLQIQPNEQISITVDLLSLYAIQEAGKYNITFNSAVSYNYQKPGFPTITVQSREEVISNTIDMTIDAPRFAAVAYKLPPNYSGCTATEISTLDTAHTEAETIALQAVSSLQNSPEDERSEAPRYRTWFGTYSQTNYDTVSTNFNQISQALSEETMSFHCDCNDASYAYVYPDQPYIIHLCTEFWTAQATGTDSQSGTLVHETSHFIVVADTNDHAYSQSNCKDLAVSNPALAIDNADSHEYFAENNPFVTMTPLPNNHFADSTAMDTTVFTVNSSNLGANKESGEPDHAGESGGSSVWWSWTAPVTGITEINTFSSDFDTLLAIYTGTELSNLVEIVSNDDADATSQSKVTFKPHAGIVYSIAVDGYDTAQGNIQLELKIDGHPLSCDINLDGSVDLTDVIKTLQIMAGSQQENDIYLQGELGNDGKIGIPEALDALRIISIQQ